MRRHFEHVTHLETVVQFESFDTRPHQTVRLWPLWKCSIGGRLFVVFVGITAIPLMEVLKQRAAALGAPRIVYARRALSIT